MKVVTKIIFFTFVLMSLSSYSQELSPDSRTQQFNIEKDLLLANFDCKTDVDDLHSVAAFATIVASAEYSKLKYHAVAGTYGVQGGLYVPANELFDLAFANKWSDAHMEFDKSVGEVVTLITKVLEKGGNIWVAEAGQSDFTAEVVKKIQSNMPEIKSKNRIFVVQHSNWNEESTDKEKLKFVRQQTTYYKIPDGNATGNGTAGYRTEEITNWQQYIKDKHLNEVWTLAIDLGNKYNGVEGRYLNESISKGGLDFSDMSEVSWILNVQNANNVDEFFTVFAK